MARCHGIVSRADTLAKWMVTYHTHTSICISASSLALGALHELPLHTNSSIWSESEGCCWSTKRLGACFILMIFLPNLIYPLPSSHSIFNPSHPYPNPGAAPHSPLFKRHAQHGAKEGTSISSPSEPSQRTGIQV